MGVTEQAIIVFDGGEVVPPGIAVTLRIENLGVLLGDRASHVTVLVLDVVVEGVGDLAAREVAGKIPDQAIVHGIGLHAG